jgi:hypothetical protein
MCGEGNGIEELTGSGALMMKLLTLTVTLLAAAAWVVLLVWQSVIVYEVWHYGGADLEAIPAILIPVTGLVVTIAVAWREYPKSVSGVLMWSCASLALALFCLLVVSAAPR